MIEWQREQPEIERWVTVASAADSSGLSPRTIRRYIRKGTVKGVKRGNLYLVNLRSLGHARRPYHRRCLNCGRAFRASKRHQKFCRDNCRLVYHNRAYRRRKREAESPDR